MELRRVRLGDVEVAPLLTALAEEYRRRYGPNDEMAVADAEEFEPPSGLFIVLRDHGVTLAGGGFRRWSSDTCEVKRMWTSAQHRRQGHATTVLRALEEAAAEQGYPFLRLETGPAQPEAVALYERRGYRRIAVYGRYRGAIAFERSLSPEARSS